MTYNERDYIIDVLKKRTEEMLSWEPEKLRAYIRHIRGPIYRELKGNEAEHMITILTIIGPYHSTNNQRTNTDYYDYMGKKYLITYGLGDKPMVEVILDDDDT